jgi:hypothetical protein
MPIKQQLPPDGDYSKEDFQPLATAPLTLSSLKTGVSKSLAKAAPLAATMEGLPPEDSGIPFDRIPYVKRDLLRVLVMATLMIALIIAANFVVARLVH